MMCTTVGNLQSVNEGWSADLCTVGISRVQSYEGNKIEERPRTAEDKTNGNLGLTTTMSTAHDHQPFTEEQLALAMQRSHLAVPAQG